MNNIGPKCWPTRLQPSDDCEIMISCQVCWRIRRWHNGRTRHSPNPEPGKVSQDCLTNGEESAAHSILARSDPLQQRPYTFAQTNLWRLQISLAARRRTIHFACGEAADHTFRLRRGGGPYISLAARRRNKQFACGEVADDRFRLWRGGGPYISLAARRRTIHFACGEAADHTFRLRRGGGP